MADYIKDLRRLVGHAPLVLATAGVFILDSDNRVLLQHRSDNGLWGVPGGILEFGESVEEAARREAYEETGLTIEDMELFKVYSGESQRYTYPNGDEVCFVSTLFLTRRFTGEIAYEEDESLDMRFFDLSCLPDAIAPTIRPMLVDLKAHVTRQ